MIVDPSNTRTLSASSVWEMSSKAASNAAAMLDDLDDALHDLHTEQLPIDIRAPIFLAPVLIVPIIARVRRWDPYPHTADALLAAPFLLDTLGNLFGVYDEFAHTDDVLHAINWVLLVGAFHAFRFRNVDNRRDAVLLGYGFGAIAIVWWEVMEWAVSEDRFGGTGALALTYEDTIGDLFLSSTGGLIGSLLAVRWLGPRRST